MGLFTRAPLHGRDGYLRGYANAKSFLAKDPCEDDRREAYRHSACARDDYDVGFFDGLTDRSPNPPMIRPDDQPWWVSAIGLLLFVAILAWVVWRVVSS